MQRHGLDIPANQLVCCEQLVETHSWKEHLRGVGGESERKKFRELLDALRG